MLENFGKGGTIDEQSKALQIGKKRDHSTLISKYLGG